MPIFPFAQFEVPGALGIADGRYLVRNAEGEADDVIVFSSLQAPPRGRRKRPRKAADASPETESLPATRITVVRATAFDGATEARSWLDRIRRDADARDDFTADARQLVNRSLHTHRAATMDPYVSELAPTTPSATRVGFGDGDELASGRWTEAVDAPPDPGKRRRRVEALRPQERLAAVLGGREQVDACETLILRVRLDLDHDRPREAALQLGPAVAAMLAELGPDAPEDQEEDLAFLRDQRKPVARIREEALTGDPPDEATTTITETLEVCERILRRRRILG